MFGCSAANEIRAGNADRRIRLPAAVIVAGKVLCRRAKTILPEAIFRCAFPAIRGTFS